MRKVFATLMILCSLISLTFGQAGSKGSKATGKAEAAVLKQLENWLDALRRSDMAALNRIIADDFMIIGAEGSVRSKEEDLAPPATEEPAETAAAPACSLESARQRSARNQADRSPRRRATAAQCRCGDRRFQCNGTSFLVN